MSFYVGLSERGQNSRGLVGELLIVIEKQCINYFENQVRYKLSEKSSLTQS